jgi:exonuclease SbcD
LTDEEDVPEAMGKLRMIYPNLMTMSYDNTRTRTNQMIGGAEDVQQKTKLELFEEFYIKQNNQPMSDVQQSFIRDLIETIWEEQR